MNQESKNDFYILDENDNIVYEDDAALVTSELGDFYKLNFTKFEKKGTYKIKIDDKETNYFEINENQQSKEKES